MNEESLIEQVRAHKSLYDVNSPDYKDLNVRREAWQEIGENLQLSAEKCKSEWTKLRNCFLNAIRRRRSRTIGQVGKHIPPWKYAQHMEFLLPYVEYRTSYSNLEEPSEFVETHRPPSSVSDPLDIDALNHGIKSEPHDTEQMEHIFKQSGPPSKRKKNDVNDAFVNLMRVNAKRQKGRYGKKRSSSHDDVELFYLSMARIAKRLPKIEEARLRMKVCHVVTETEIAQLEREPQQTHNEYWPRSSSSS